MKVGDMVRWRQTPFGRTVRTEGESDTGVVVSELRHGINRSFVDVLVDGAVISVNWKALEVISESR